MSQHDQEFERRAKAALEGSISALDADTRRSLAASRARALDQKQGASRWLPSSNWLPATALAACAVLAVALYIDRQQAAEPALAAQADPDVALEILLASSDDTDADSDPDFYILMDAMLNEEDAQNAG